MVLTLTTNMLFSCGLCRERLPIDMKTLPCLHNFCRCCITKIFRNQIRQSPDITTGNGGNDPLFYCPECLNKIVIPDPPDGVEEKYSNENGRVQWILDNLEPNAFILNLLRAKELQQNVQVCERCFKGHATVSASAWCQDCNKCFCASCLKLHQDFTMHSEIVFLSDEDLPHLKDLMPRRKCDRHKEVVNTYCTRCRLCLCQSCWMVHFTMTGNCPPPLPLDKLAGLRKADGNVLLSGIKSTENNIKRRNEDILSRMNKIQSEFQAAGDQVRADRDRLMKILAKKADELLSSLSSAAKAETEELANQLTQNGTWLNQMDFLALNVNTLLTNASCTDLVSCFPKLDTRWDHLQACINSGGISCKKLSVNYSGQYAKLLQNSEHMAIGRVEVGEEMAGIETLKADRVAIDSPDPEMQSAIESGVQCQMADLKDAESQTNIVHTIDSCVQSGESTPRLIDFDRWSISGNSIDFVDGITVSGDGHVFLCCRSLKQVREYSAEGICIYACPLPCRPLDICGLTDDVLGVVSAEDHQLVILLRKPFDKETMRIHKVVQTKHNYISICGFGNLFYACQRSGHVELINAEGNVMIVVSQPSTKADQRHRIVLGSTTHSVVFLNYVDQTLTLYGRSGKVYSTANARNRGGQHSTSHMCMDPHGTLFACSNTGIYTVATEDSPSFLLWAFEEKKLKCSPRMCIGGNRLFLSYFTNNKKEIRVFKISYLS